MPKPRYRIRRDGNHADAIGWFSDLACSVVDLSTVTGEGIPDLLVGRYGQSWLIEVKDPTQDPNKRALRPGQDEFAQLWRGAPVRKCETLEDAQRIVDEMRIYSRDRWLVKPRASPS